MYKKGRNATSPPYTVGTATTTSQRSNISGISVMSNKQPKLVAASSSSSSSSSSPSTKPSSTPSTSSTTSQPKRTDATKGKPQDVGGTVEESSHPIPPPPAVLKKRDSQLTKDLMISYSHVDKEMMTKIRDALEENGISVWVDVSGLQAGVDFLSKIGQAIIDCKLFLSLLSKSSVKSKYCQDELALAYVSNRSIFPVLLDDGAELKPMMDTGMKLQLARYDWTNLGRDPATFKKEFNGLLKKLKDELLSQHNMDRPDSAMSDARARTPAVGGLERQDTRHKLNIKSKRTTSPSKVGVEVMGPDQFWKDNFGSSKQEIEWPQFLKAFDSVYKGQLDSMLLDNEREWLHGVLARELEVEEDVLYQFNLMAFCNVDGQYQSLWERVNDQASESFAMVQVFDMDSSVRVEAIENLGKFRSAAVIDALRDLLADSDANVRAVATISLARTEAKDPVTVKFLMKTLNDKDRLVREAGCLALGHLQAKQAVNKLLHMWRNDVISHVREAANVALGQIGGDEVEKAMRVTKILADEIRQLTTA